MAKPTLPPYRYRGARAMVELHDRTLREFVGVWHQAQAQELVLPETQDPDYGSLELLLKHVCGAARGYMVWMCEMLGLPDPAIQVTPEAGALAEHIHSYVDHVLVQWQTPLADVPEERFEREEFQSRWKTTYCIDAMLEHAVMHPIRHSHQLRSLLDAR